MIAGGSGLACALGEIPSVLGMDGNERSLINFPCRDGGGGGFFFSSVISSLGIVCPTTSLLSELREDPSVALRLYSCTDLCEIDAVSTSRLLSLGAPSAVTDVIGADVVSLCTIPLSPVSSILLNESTSIDCLTGTPICRDVDLPSSAFAGLLGTLANLLSVLFTASSFSGSGGDTTPLLALLLFILALYIACSIAPSFSSVSASTWNGSA